MIQARSKLAISDSEEPICPPEQARLDDACPAPSLPDTESEWEEEKKDGRKADAKGQYSYLRVYPEGPLSCSSSNQ